MGYRLDQPYLFMMDFGGDWTKLLALLSTMPTQGLRSIDVKDGRASIEFYEAFDEDVGRLFSWCSKLRSTMPKGSCELFSRDPEDGMAHIWGIVTWSNCSRPRRYPVLERLQARVAQATKETE